MEKEVWWFRNSMQSYKLVLKIHLVIFTGYKNFNSASYCYFNIVKLNKGKFYNEIPRQIPAHSKD